MDEFENKFKETKEKIINEGKTIALYHPIITAKSWIMDLYPYEIERNYLLFADIAGEDSYNNIIVIKQKINKYWHCYLYINSELTKHQLMELYRGQRILPPLGDINISNRCLKDPDVERIYNLQMAPATGKHIKSLGKYFANLYPEEAKKLKKWQADVLSNQHIDRSHTKDRFYVHSFLNALRGIKDKSNKDFKVFIDLNNWQYNAAIPKTKVVRDLIKDSYIFWDHYYTDMFFHKKYVEDTDRVAWYVECDLIKLRYVPDHIVEQCIIQFLRDDLHDDLNAIADRARSEYLKRYFPDKSSISDIHPSEFNWDGWYQIADKYFDIRSPELQAIIKK